MAFNASVDLGTVGKGITGQTVSISGCTGPSCASGCSSLATSQAVSSFPKTLTGIPDGTLSLFVKVDGGDCVGTNQCITIAGIPSATPTPTNTPTSTAGVTSTPTSTGTPTSTATPTITPTSTITATPTATQSDGPICYFTQTGMGIPLSGGVSSTSGLIKVTTGTINVWAKYNSAGTSSGTASFGLTIGGVTATGSFTITSSGQVGYTNSGGSNNLTYIVLTPGTYQYTLTKSDNLTSGNNVNIVYTTGATDPAVATNIQPCLSEPPGPYLTLGEITPTPTSTVTVYNFYQANEVLLSSYGTTYCSLVGYTMTGPVYSSVSFSSLAMGDFIYTDPQLSQPLVGNGTDYRIAISNDSGVNTNAGLFKWVSVNGSGEIVGGPGTYTCGGNENIQ